MSKYIAPKKYTGSDLNSPDNKYFNFLVQLVRLVLNIYMRNKHELSISLFTTAGQVGTPPSLRANSLFQILFFQPNYVCEYVESYLR